jgi:hypothetical protein
METITFAEYEKLLSGPMGEWYDGRWSYYGPVVDLLMDWNLKAHSNWGRAS